ncbi:MAG: T9SS type A sorting domain-containing protein [Bacteroidia bacterium]|nr:T9SS type A sorting domain-containing protein [Bacteroidia bacterium]
MKTRFTLNLLIGLFLLATTGIQAQFQWAIQAGGGTYDKGKRIVTDATGNNYTAGEFAGNVDFDPGPGTTTISPAGCYLLKLDGSSNFGWVKSWGAYTVDGISRDASGNILLCGFFYNTVDFDPGPATYTLMSINGTLPNTYAMKLDPNGNFLWAVRFGDSNTSAKDISNDASGNVLISGGYSGIQDFDPSASTFTIGTTNNVSGYVLKLDPAGNFTWVKEVRNASLGTSASIFGVETDGTGNVITTGVFNGTADFDPSASTYTLNATTFAYASSFVQKLDASGNFVWAKAIGGPTVTMSSYAVAIDGSNNVYSCGSFGSSVDFDPSAGTTSLTATGSSDAYVWKLDANGNFVWARGMGNNSWTIRLDAVGDVYSIAYATSGEDVDPGPGTYTVTGSYIQKLDAGGNFVWARGYGVFPSFNDISVNGSDIYFTGRFNGTVDFDPDAPVYNLVMGFGGYALFISKLSAYPVSVNEYGMNTSNLKVFPNPSNGEINLSFEKPYTGSLQVYDVSGKQIHSQTLTKETELKLDLTKYNRGIYFVKTEEASFKIVIQ